MNTLKCPCQKCESRVVGCHATCNRYSEWKLLYQKAKSRFKNSNDAYEILARGKEKFKVKKIQRH